MLLDFIMVRLTQMNKTYSELLTFKTFEDRFNYLKLNGVVGESIFGFHRFVNQSFYSSSKWRTTRSKVIIRDDGCDLGIPDRQIFDKIYIHHLNPVTLEQLERDDRLLFDLENLVCVSYDTHLAIHYGDINLVKNSFVERKPGDTTLW